MADKSNPDILYTIVDEAPELASASLLPIIRFFSNAAGVNFGTKDISLAGRIISTFPEQLTEKQRQPDDLGNLGQIVKTKTANVIKLPNISASVPQLLSAINELQKQGYKLPNYPDEPKTNEELEIQARYEMGFVEDIDVDRMTLVLSDIQTQSDNINRMADVSHLYLKLVL